MPAKLPCARRKKNHAIPILSYALIAAAFVVAGFVKGAIGVGLPTVVMALLSLFLAPAQAAALLIIPAIGTNIWQMAAGPAAAKLIRRFATMMLGIFAGTFLTIGLLTRSGSAGPAILGLVLAAYGLYGLFARRFQIAMAAERWLSPLMGLATGLLSGATGVFVIPAVPYLQAIGLERDELVQALGLSFTVSTVALAVGLLRLDAFAASTLWASALALVPALLGMQIGQWLRQRIAVSTFRRIFFAGLLLLGATLALA